MRKKNSKTPSVVGLDLDPGHIAAAEVDVNGRISVKRSARSRRCAPASCATARSSDGPALTEALRELWAEHKLPDSASASASPASASSCARWTCRR